MLPPSAETSKIARQTAKEPEPVKLGSFSAGTSFSRLMLQHDIPVARRESVHSSGGCDVQLSGLWQRKDRTTTTALLGRERGGRRAAVLAGW